MAQEGKALAATILLVAGVLLGINYMVTEDRDNWWLVIAILLIGFSIAIWAWMIRERLAEERARRAEEGEEAERAMKDAEEQMARLTDKTRKEIEPGKPSKTAAPLSKTAPKAEPEPEPPVVSTVPDVTPDTPEPAPETNLETVEELDPSLVDQIAPEPEVEAQPEVETKPAPEPEPEPETQPADIVSVSEAGEGDHLEIVEGIGPKYDAALRAVGITTFAQVAAMSEEELVKVIRDAGMRKPPSVGTWAEQAKLAAEGRWDELDKLKDSLTAGRRD